MDALLDRSAAKPRRQRAACRPRVIMIGPALSVKGGVSAVESLLIEALHPHCRLIHVATLTDGGAARKLLAALTGLACFVAQCIRMRPHIVHVHFASRASFWRKSAFILIARCLGIKVIGHAHGAQFDIFYDVESGPARKRFIHSILRRMHRLVAISSWWRRYYGNLRACRTVLIPNPVRRQEIVRRATGNRERTVLMMGRLGERKGTYDLLAAIPQVLARCPHTRFVLAGDGDLERCRALVAAQPWRDRVVIPGWTSGDARLRLYREADLFVLPSYNEGLPMGILEAMSFGLPVVSTPVGGIPELVEHGRSGLLVQPGDVPALGDAICDLLSDVNRLVAFGQHAKNIVDNRFELGRIAARFGHLYGALSA